MYLDLFFLLNLAVDYWLLRIMAKLLFRKPGFLRLAGGSVMGAIAAVFITYQAGFWLHLIAILTLPAGMLLLVFGPLSWQVVLFSWLVFFSISFLTGGAAFALQGLAMGSGSLDKGMLFALLAGACMILHLVPARARSFLDERKWQHRLKLELLIRWQGKEKIIPALLDTGNRLKDPVRDRPVIIVDFRSIDELLPQEISRRLEDLHLESWEILLDFQAHPLACNFLLIPFQSLGSREQLMLGLCPQEVAIFSGYQQWSLGSGALLGLNRRGFGAAAEYQALLPPEVIGGCDIG